MKLKLFEGASGKMRHLGFKLNQASPDILVVVGVVGVVTATVMACRATLKVDEVMDEYEEKVKEINDTAEDPKYAERYSKEDCETDLRTVKIKTAIKLVRLYAPAVIIGTLSIGCIVGSHCMLQKRNASLMAAYTALETSVKEYRKRVAAKVGEEEEKDLYRGVRREKVTETVTDEKGKEKKVEKTVMTVEPNEYSRLYDSTCIGWERNASMNWFQLRCIQTALNDKLRGKGYLFLNEVYEELGMTLCEHGQIVGWLARPEDPTWDNYVDLGLGEEPDKDAEPNMWVTPNVQGMIIDKLGACGWWKK